MSELKKATLHLDNEVTFMLNNISIRKEFTKEILSYLIRKNNIHKESIDTILKEVTSSKVKGGE